MNMKCITLAVAIASAISAQAALNPIIQTVTIPPGFSPNTTGGATFASLPLTGTVNGAANGLYSGLGTLISVSYSLDGYTYIDYTVVSGTNPTVALSGTGSPDFNAHVYAKGPAASSPKLDAIVNIPVTSVGSPSSGTIGVASPPVSIPLTDDSANLSSYNIAGPVTFTLDGVGRATLAGDDQVQGSITGKAAGKITVKYVFQTQDVPEASTYAALGALALAGGFVGLRRRLA